MSNSEFSGEGDSLPPLPGGIIIPDTSEQLLHMIDEAPESAYMQMAMEVVRNLVDAQSRLRDIEQEFLTQRGRVCAFFSKPVEGGWRLSALTTDNDSRFGEVWRVITNQETDMLGRRSHLEYSEYAITKNYILFGHAGGVAHKPLSGSWRYDQLDGCVLLQKKTDHYIQLRGKGAAQVVPALRDTSPDAHTYTERYRALEFLTGELLGTLTAVEHDEMITSCKIVSKE